MTSTPAKMCSRSSGSGSGSTYDFAAEALSRITRQPRSTLCFAAFDPDTATGDPTNPHAFRKLSLNEELCRPKRIVIEMTPQGTSTWRFVPNARREPGVEDEGVWPRAVNVCGGFRTLTQDEWDLYKLDPALECLVRIHPHHPTVTRREMPPSMSPELEATKSFLNESRGEGSSATGHLARAKRRLSSDTIARRLSGSNSVGQRKKARIPSEPHFSEGEDGENAEEGEEIDMVPDDTPRSSRRRPVADRLRKVRANRDEARRRLREEMAKRKAMSGLDIIEDGHDDDDEMLWVETPIEMPPFSPKLSPSTTPKRKVEYFSDDDAQFLESSDDEKNCPRFKNYEWTGKSKKTRTVSPEYARKKVETKRKKREVARKMKLDARKKARSDAKHENWMKQLFERSNSTTPTTDTTMATGPDPFSLNFDNSSPEMPHAERANNQTQYAQQEPQYAQSFDSGQYAEAQQEMPYSDHVPQERPDDGQPQYTEQSNQETPFTQSWDSSQETLAADKARRMAAIEESRRKLAELEKDKPLWEEQARKRAALEAEEKTRAEAARQAKRAVGSQQKEKETMKQRAAHEARREREAAADELCKKRENARNLALKENRAWLAKGWSDQRAIERYVDLCNTFDALNFAKGDVIVFETIPWPVLKKPGSFGVEDIDWASAEEFFLKAEQLLPSREYKSLVEKSHKRFHPDRWRSRRVLQSVEDEEEKECLETAANTVAQALTPVWQAVR